ANLDRLKSAAELAHSLSPKAAPVVETILGGKPDQWEQVKDRMVERLRDWAKVATEARTVIAVKPHVGNGLDTPEGGRWRVRQMPSPWLKLAYDYSHLLLRDFAMAKSMTTLLPESVFVHVKDARGHAGKFEFLLPGEGTINYEAYFRTLKSTGYRGPVMV